MIEIVYDKEAANRQSRDYKPYKMPKNIRQIGNPPVKKKIYIEDYVMTFLRKIAEPGNTTSRGAILLGEYFKDDEGETLFISGAVEAQNLEFDVEQIKFDDATWSSIYTEINKYFDNLSVVGWFLSRMGFSVNINEKISNIHMKHFSGNDKVLFMMDSLECEDAFYMYEKGSMVRQRGYYIYYVRNEQMQNYIISRKNSISEDKNLEILRKDAQLVKNFQEMRQETKEPEKPEKNYFLYAVSSFVLIFALSVGIVLSGSYDRMKDIESQVRRMEMENDNSDVAVFSDNQGNRDDSGADTDTEFSKTETSSHEDAGSSEQATDTEKTTGDEKASEEQTGAAGPVENTESADHTEDSLPADTQPVNYYEIEEGDTLMSISLKLFGSPDYVDEIMEANHLGEGDIIYTGEKIVIPYIE